VDESTSPGNASENPYDAPQFNSAAPQTEMRREGSTTIPRTFGILNIIFGGLLCVCGAGYGLYIVGTLFMGPAMQAQQGQMKATLEAEWSDRLQDLRDQEAAAETDEDKEFYKSQREALQANPPVVPDMSGMMDFGKDPRVIGYGIVDVLSGLLLNVLLITAGAGLLGLKEWSRRLSLQIAVVKLIRLFLLETYMIVVVIPLIAEGFVRMFESAQQGAGGGAADPAEVASAMSIMYSSMAVAMLIFGAIYPVIMLICLTRERVKVACQGTVVSE